MPELVSCIIVLVAELTLLKIVFTLEVLSSLSQSSTKKVSENTMVLGNDANAEPLKYHPLLYAGTTLVPTKLSPLEVF